MLNWKLPLVLSSVALLAACAGPGSGPHGAKAHSAYAGHHQHHQHMQAMQKDMAGARTPEERQAIMMKHMQAMHPGVAMQPGMSQQDMMALCMQHMQTMHGPQGMPGHQGMHGPQGMPGGLMPPAR
jgi:hypothetical protein